MFCVLIGNGGHASVIKDILKLSGYMVSQIYDDFDTSCDGTVDALIETIQKDETKRNVFIAIGDNLERWSCQSRLKSVEKWIDYINCIHPSAIIADSVCLGMGNCICAGVVIEAKTKLGNFNICNTQSSLNHHCVIGNFVHVAPHASLCGRVHIKDKTIIATGVHIIPNIVVEEGCQIGVGSVLLSSVTKRNTKVFGVYGKTSLQ